MMMQVQILDLPVMVRSEHIHESLYLLQSGFLHYQKVQKENLNLSMTQLNQLVASIVSNLLN